MCVVYAHQDKEDDQLIGVKSTALRFGANTKKWLSLFSGTTIVGLMTAGLNAGMPWPYFVGTTLGAAHLAWQVLTLQTENREDCLAKFVSNNWFGWTIFGGIVASSNILM